MCLMFGEVVRRALEFQWKERGKGALIGDLMVSVLAYMDVSVYSCEYARLSPIDVKRVAVRRTSRPSANGRGSNENLTHLGC